jgi:excisionase family DNA binding protein
MLSVEVRFVVAGQEVSLDSFAEAFVASVRKAVHEEMSRHTVKLASENRELIQSLAPKTPPKVVSIREAARLMGISSRTVDNYLAQKILRSVRFGKRVLIPMKSVNEVLSRGVSWRSHRKPLT